MNESHFGWAKETTHRKYYIVSFLKKENLKTDKILLKLKKKSMYQNCGFLWRIEVRNSGSWLEWNRRTFWWEGTVWCHDRGMGYPGVPPCQNGKAKFCT